MTKRRDFIKKSLLGTAGMAIGGMGFSSRSYASITGANDTIRLAVVGLGARGSGSHISEFGSIPGVKIAAVCDPDHERLSAGAQKVSDRDIVPWQEMYDTYVKYLNGLGIDPGTSVIGPWLECDSERESVRDNAKASEIVKGIYRKGYEVPEIAW